MPNDCAITFRFAEPHDVETIRAVEFDASLRFVSVGMTGIADAPPMAREVVERKIAAREIIVALDEQTACAGFVMFEPQPMRIYVQELDVLNSHAGRRIGAALLEEVAQIARARHLTQLVLSTYRDVPWNAPYYRRLGFRDLDPSELDAALLARRDAHIARGLDESKRVFMRRDLV